VFPVDVQAPVVVVTPAVLLLEPWALLPGRTYVFQFTATLGANAALTDGVTTITVVVNQPPMGGVVNVEPLVGVAVTSSFSFYTVPSAWRDRVEDLPLRYRFAYWTAAVAANASGRVLLSEWSPLPALHSVRLPVFPGAAPNTSVRALCYARDVLGSEGVSNVTIDNEPAVITLLPLTASSSPSSGLLGALQTVDAAADATLQTPPTAEAGSLAQIQVSSLHPCADVFSSSAHCLCTLSKFYADYLVPLCYPRHSRPWCVPL
jgi:hypothetical protein